MTDMQWGQVVLGQQAAMRERISSMAYRTDLGRDMVDDLLSDATLALLGKRGKAFDAKRGSVTVFCLMVTYQVVNDKIRSMARGGQYGAYCGFGNTQLNAETSDGAIPTRTKARSPERMENAPKGSETTQLLDKARNQDDDAGRSVRVSGRAFTDIDALVTRDSSSALIERNWLASARAQVVAVLPQLNADDRALWDSLADGSFDAATYARRAGLATATAHVRTNRLRAKVRSLLKAAA